MRYVFSSNQTVHYQFPTHVNELVMDRSHSDQSEVFIVVLEPGQSPPLHKHDDMEQVFYVLEGQGTLLIGKDRRQFPIAPGDTVRIPPSTLHTVQTGDERLRYFAVDCFLAKPDKEPTWDEHIRVVCREQGWDFNAVKKTK